MGMKTERKRRGKTFESGISYVELAKELGVTRQYIYMLAKQGFDEDAVRSQCTENSLFGICRERGLKYRTVYSRLRRGWSREDALNLPIKEGYKQKENENGEHRKN